MLWPLVPLSRWLILDLTLLHFSFQFRESKGLIQFLWCRGEQLRVFTYMVQTRDSIALCVLGSSQQWQLGKRCQDHYTGSSVICLTAHTNLTASWAKYSGCNPDPKNCHPSAQREDHIHGRVSAIHQKPPHRHRDGGDRQGFKRPGEEPSSRKMRQQSKNSSGFLQRFLCCCCCRAWASLPKQAMIQGQAKSLCYSVTEPSSIASTAGCLSLLSGCLKTFLDKLLVKRLMLMLYMSDQIMLINQRTLKGQDL